MVFVGAFAGSASAGGESGLPPYNGVMTFGAIHGPSDPEEYSWEVILGEGQSLKSIDSQSAQVEYEDGTRAFLIQVEAAHDANGSTVPTSLSVSEGNVITLSVHHRAGNPAAGGAPFVYPITPGLGWDGGFHTEIIPRPKDEQELREERERQAKEEWEATQAADVGKSSRACTVPRLRLKSLKAAKRQLTKADCRIGKVGKRRGITARTGRVVKQTPKPGLVMAPGTAVNVTLGE